MYSKPCVRGQPILTQVLVRLYHLDKFDDATLLRQEIANLFTGFIKKPSPEQAPIDPLTGKPLVFGADCLPMVAMEPGTMQELAPGEEEEAIKNITSALRISEFEWNPVEQTTERSLTGALLVQTNTWQANHSLWQWRGWLGFPADGQEPVRSLQSGQ